MSFIPENELERALVQAVQNPVAAPDFYRLLLESDLLVLGTAQGQENARDQFTVTPGGKFNFVIGVKDGAQFLPVFSSLPRMQDYVRQESKYLSIKGRDLLEMTRGAPVTLNPSSEYGKEFSAREVLQLLDGPGAREIRTIVGAFPIALVEALSAAFTLRPDIEAAWMIQVTFADRAKEPHPLVGIELDSKTGGDWPSLIQAIEDAAEKSAPGMVFDVQRVDRHNPADLTNALLQVPPFYQRHASSSGTLN
jgi:SseB protein N-terminal domain/SseB protein C-terminal domain